MVETFRVDPATIRRDQTATATVSLAGAPAGTLLTLAWFGPDGWLVFDQQATVNGKSVSFSIPAARFVNPAVYHGSLDAGVVHLGDTTLTVSG